MGRTRRSWRGAPGGAIGRARIGRMLVACTRDHDWDRLPPGLEAVLPAENEAPAVVRQACLHGVEACVYLSMRTLPRTDARLVDSLHDAYLAALQSHLRTRRDLAIAADALDGAGLPWLAFKGPVLSENDYSRSDLRSYADLDLLVAPSGLREAVAALEAAGGELLDRNWQLARARGHGELHVRMPGDTVTDLHWNVLNNPSDRAMFPIDTEHLLQRSGVFTLDATTVRRLAPEDTIVHLALHACLSGGTRLLWCKDLEQTAAGPHVDWRSVVDRAHEWRAGPATAVMLAIASRTMGFGVSDEVLRELSPGPVWRSLTRLTASASPVEGWNGGGSLLRSLCRSTRADDWRSARALARRFAALLKSRSGGAPHPTDRDPSSPRSLLYPAGGERERAAYFRDVERSADP